MSTPPVERPPSRELIAEEIRVLLVRRRRTGQWLAGAIGRSQSYVSRRLLAEMPFDTDDLERIGHALGVSVTDLLPASAREVTAGNRQKPVDPLAQRIIATIGQPRAGRATLTQRALRVGRLDSPRQPDRTGHRRRPVAVVTQTARSLSDA